MAIESGEALRLFRANIDISGDLVGFIVRAATSETALETIAEPIHSAFPGYQYDPTDVMHEVYPISSVDLRKAQSYTNSWRDNQNSSPVSTKRAL